MFYLFPVFSVDGVVSKWLALVSLKLLGLQTLDKGIIITIFIISPSRVQRNVQRQPNWLER